jgi:DNA-binding SARP family transcriptional activator
LLKNQWVPFHGRTLLVVVLGGSSYPGHSQRVLQTGQVMIAPLGLELCLLGRAELRLNGAPLNITVRKLLSLVVYLALEGPSSRSTLSGLLWSELNGADARRNLRQRLYRLSPPELSACLLVEADLVSLVGSVSSDAMAFERAMLESDFARAVGLYRGPLLDGLQLEEASDFDDWLDLKRDAFERAHQRALAGWADQLEAAGSNTQALAQHLRLIELNPLLELHQRQVMRLRGLSGDRAEAIAGFERFRALLESELGLEPMPETVQLAESIRRQGTLEPRNVCASAIHLRRTPTLDCESVPFFKAITYWPEHTSPRALKLSASPMIGWDRRRPSLELDASKRCLEITQRRKHRSSWV